MDKTELLPSLLDEDAQGIESTSSEDDEVSSDVDSLGLLAEVVAEDVQIPLFEGVDRLENKENIFF